MSRAGTGFLSRGHFNKGLNELTGRYKKYYNIFNTQVKEHLHVRK